MHSKKFGTSILIAIGTLFLLDFIFLLIIGAVTNLGTVLPLGLGVIFLTMGVAKKNNIKLPSIKNVVIRRILVLMILIFSASFIIIEGLIMASIKSDKGVKADYLIILGAGLKGDKMTLTFRNRVDKALEYLKQNDDVKVIVSGGQGTGETITEAEAMEIYLVKNGISKDRIIKEEKSTSTMENFKFSRELLGGTTIGKQKLMIVTSDFHMYRAKILARRNGFEPYGLPSRTWVPILPNSCMREYFAVIKSLLFDK